MALKQEHRMLRLKTPLGENELVATGFRGHEEISRLFHFEVDMISDNNDIAASQIVGKGVTLSINLADGSMRHVNGCVRRFSAGDEDLQGRRNYRAELVPWLWFLTRTTDCRVFQDKTAPEIIQQVFQDLGFSDYTFQLGSHPKRTYCVQYRETDFAFVSRLMEEEGIFYFFKHEEGKHTLVLADQKGAYATCAESEVDHPIDTGTRAVEDHITDWEHRYEFRTGKWAQTDYNFEEQPARSEKTPSTLLMTNENSTVKLDDIDKFEFYDYPGIYANKDDGGALTRVRMEEEETPHDIVEAESNCKSFVAGHKFTVRSHQSKAEKGKSFVITSIDHKAAEPWAYETGTQVGFDYQNKFECIPDSVTFRPARLTPRPVVRGVQTAVVTGPPGEEIWPDKYGRVKVQFYWDREGKRDENTSCWIRVSQPYAGKNWGWMCIPRIGQEVVVNFLEGDPDRPLITGVVYNAEQMPPYELPAEKTKSYLKSNSSPGGEGYNELRFEDKDGQEQIFLHAQRNLDTRVQADSMENVGGDRHLIVGGEKDGSKSGDQYEMVYRDKHLKVHRNQEEHIGGDMKLLVGGIDGPGNHDIIVKNDKKEQIDKNSHLKVGLDRNEKTGKNQSLEVGVNLQEKVGMNYAVEAGSEIHLKGGMTVIIEAGMQLTLKGPGGFIDISPAGVTVQGILVNINSGGAAGAGSGSSPTSPEAPKAAAPVEPTPADDSKSGQKSTPF
ncbi:MAG: type VI secretion system Vgr family protein [Thermoguttaceae bacterium]|jgi:type VI secretion system secreted protein VgrG